MKRVMILCEGQAEEQFVNRILVPYLLTQDIYVTPVVLPTKRYLSGGKGKLGGVTTYAKISRELRILCKDRDAFITSMLDYFRLPTDTPCIDIQRTDIYQHVAEIEAAIDRDIQSPNCHANLMVHEFEALLFSDPSAFEGIADEESIQKLAEIKASFETPEDINSGPETAPSKRILQIKPDYRKVAQGVEIAERIGIDKMKACCPHFQEWIERIRND